MRSALLADLPVLGGLKLDCSRGIASAGEMEKLREFGRRHEELKKRIHSFRIPLPPWGVNVMRAVYISIPLLVGGWVMSWAQQRASVNVGQVRSCTAVLPPVGHRGRQAVAPRPGAGQPRVRPPAAR